MKTTSAEEIATNSTLSPAYESSTAKKGPAPGSLAGMFLATEAASWYLPLRMVSVSTSMRNATAPVVQPIAPHTAHLWFIWQLRACADCCCRSCSKIELASMS